VASDSAGTPGVADTAPITQLFSRLLVKLVTSTTSTLPSQRPRDTPIALRIAGSSGGRPSSGIVR
jgi:hypothetical protein